MGLAAIGLILMICIGGFVSSDVYTSDGMEITSVVPASPSEGILSEGMIINEVNNQKVDGYQSYVKVMNTTHIGDTINIKTDTGSYNITSTTNPNNSSKSYIGIRSQEHKIVKPEFESRYGLFIPWLLTQLREFFYLVFLLNFSVGTFNLLPMKPLDGGLILEEFVSFRINDERRKDFNNTLNYFTRPLPDGVRCWLSRRLNNILNFLHNHELSEDKAEFVVQAMSHIFIVILLILIIYGMVPGILKML
jgi:membrane-associated protease RseP (regulator of RpoE activity)